MGVMDTAMVMDSATTDTDTATTARGLLRLSPRLRPRLWLIPTTAMAMVSDTAMDTTATDMDMAMALDTTDVATMVVTTARGLLMLSPRLRPRLWLIPTTATATVSDTPDTAMDTEATADADPYYGYGYGRYYGGLGYYGRGYYGHGYGLHGYGHGYGYGYYG